MSLKEDLIRINFSFSALLDAVNSLLEEPIEDLTELPAALEKELEK